MADPREIIRQAMQTHIDGSMRVVDRKWHAFCDCGDDLGDTAGPLVDSSYDRAGRLHQRHLAEAIRDALTDAGLLVEPEGETRTDPLTAVISVRFTDAEAAALQHYANQRTWSVSEALRHIIREQLRTRDALDAALRRSQP